MFRGSRYQYDPNGRVRDAMAHIWTALVPEPRVALDAHFGAIADELLREMGGRMWRNREAACLGLADLLQASLHHAFAQSGLTSMQMILAPWVANLQLCLACIVTAGLRPFDG